MKYQIYNFLSNNNHKNLVKYYQYKNANIYEFHILSFMYTCDKDAYYKYRESKDINPFSDNIISIKALNNDITCIVLIRKDGEESINKWAKAYISLQDHWKIIAEKRYLDLGIIVDVYELTKT